MNNILQIGKNLGMRHNVSFRVIDNATQKVVSTHVGHNAATNSMLLGIAHYLVGDGIFNQAPSMLTQYVPKFISLGTMGLLNQDEDEYGLPAGIGVVPNVDEEQRFKDYMDQAPGFGADGYDANSNNGRSYFGLGPKFEDRLGGLSSLPDGRPSINCELIATSHPRVSISFRDIVPETESEIKNTIDVVYSAMISTGALAKFREPGRDYIFITEAGLWSRRDWDDSGENGLLAAYRIAPPDSENWDMSVPSNRDILKQNIIRVGKNQVVQVIWKIQLGSLEQLNSTVLHPEKEKLRWIIWNGSANTDPDDNPNNPGDINEEESKFTFVANLFQYINSIKQDVKILNLQSKEDNYDYNI